jgi:hypothetical protein
MIILVVSIFRFPKSQEAADIVVQSVMDIYNLSKERTSHQQSLGTHLCRALLQFSNCHLVDLQHLDLLQRSIRRVDSLDDHGKCSGRWFRNG